MTLSFSARIDGTSIRCQITSSVPLKTPTFCFSLMSVPLCRSGGVLVRQVAGYGEVVLPDLAGGVPHVVELAYASGAAPSNRAYLPLGAYLRSGSQCLELPQLPAGIAAAEPNTAEPFAGPRLVPQPAAWTPTGGTMALGAVSTTHPAFIDADALGTRTGLAPLLGAGPKMEVIDDPDMEPEAYRLELTQTALCLTAASRAGVFHGAVTLLQLRATHEGEVPCGVIEDGPRFGWRGQHLDCSRHFFEVPTILRLLDLMALLKLNRFHWHIADDEAFRLDLPELPGLEATHWRGEGALVPGVFGGGIRAGGCYRAEDVAAILQRAAANGIEVMPEIEIPAHSFCLGRAFPATREPGDNGGEVSVQGYAQNVLSPARPESWDLWERLAKAVAARFPLPLLHLGCDELPAGSWSGAPEVARLKAREGLQSTEDVQGWLMARLAGRLAARGLRSAAWEEAVQGVQGGIGHEALIFSWTGQGAGITAARAGHEVVMCPAQNVYLDMAHSADPADWGATWAGVTPLEKVVDWQVVPRGAGDIAGKIIGVQGTFWGEFTTADAELEPMLAPRLLGVAAKAWESEGRTDGAALRRLAGHWRTLFDAMDWEWNRSA